MGPASSGPLPGYVTAVNEKDYGTVITKWASHKLVNVHTRQPMKLLPLQKKLVLFTSHEKNHLFRQELLN